MSFLTCRRFRSITARLEPEEFSNKQSDFVSKHENKCESCRVIYRAQSIGLDLLKSGASEVLDDTISKSYAESIIRSLAIENKRDSWWYWWPAGLGAGIAALAAFAAIQLATGSGSFRPIFYKGQEARNTQAGISKTLSAIQQYNR